MRRLAEIGKLFRHGAEFALTLESDVGAGESSPMAGQGKLQNIFGGLIFGALMFFGAFYLHWWNEGNAVKQFKTIGDLGKNTVEVSALLEACR